MGERQVKIRVGRSYWARCLDLDGDWNFQIIATVDRDGITYFVGMMSGVPWNGSAQLFREDGTSLDCSGHALGYEIYEVSRSKLKWSVIAPNEASTPSAKETPATA